jgi:hypothetical protein
MKYYEINETAARQAREMWSFRDYQKGEETGAYRSQVDKCYSLDDTERGDGGFGSTGK